MAGPALYDPAQVIGTFLGVPVVGYADGTFISVEQANDSYSFYVGAGGETARARSQDESGTVTVTLMQTSPTNDLFSTAYNADKLTGTGIGPFMLKDNLGRTLLLIPNAYVKKLATAEFGKEVGTREWTLQGDKVRGTVGGS